VPSKAKLPGQEFFKVKEHKHRRTVMKNIILLFAAACSFLLFSCGLMSDDKTTFIADPARANQLVAQNQTEVSKVFNAISGQDFNNVSDLDSIDLGAALENYQDALAADPSNSTARLGVSVFTLGQLKEDGNVQSNLDSIQIWVDGSNSPFFADSAQSAAAPKRLGKLVKKLELLSRTDPPAIHALQNLLEQKVLVPMDEAIVNLKYIVDNDPNFSYDITIITEMDTQRIHLDNGEVYALLSGLSLFKALINFTVCYNLDVDQSGSYAAFDSEMTARARLVELMDPASPFLKVRSGKENQLNEIPVLLVNAIDYARDCIDFVSAETGDQTNDPITFSAADSSFISEARKGLDSARSWLTGVKTVKVADILGKDTLPGETFQIDLAKLFTIQDFKALLPLHGFYAPTSWDSVIRSDTNWDAMIISWNNTTGSNDTLRGRYRNMVCDSTWTNCTFDTVWDVNIVTQGPVYLTNDAAQITAFYLDSGGINPAISSFETLQDPTPDQMKAEMAKILVFPDPTFNGVFPDMTNTRLFDLLITLMEGSRQPMDTTMYMPKSLNGELSPLSALSRLLP
jgi:hypothetical protein